MLKPRRRVAGLVLGLVLVGAVVFAGYRIVGAANAGVAGRAALARAEVEANAGRRDQARGQLVAARDAFARAGQELGSLGPLSPVIRVTPLLRVQLRAAESFTEAGTDLSAAGVDLLDVATELSGPGDGLSPPPGTLDRLEMARRALVGGISTIDTAIARVRAFDRYRLIGPLGGVRRDLSVRLPKVADRARSSERGVSALAEFVGASGPRRYLFLSQNPDEVRPTGGYIGTYGLVTAVGGNLSLSRYEGSEVWTVPRPSAVVPPEKTASPFRLYDPPRPQSLGNVNAIPDWPQVAQLAAELWERGGEEPVDGVVSFTPGLMARILAVVGPVVLDGYGEEVTAANVGERLDFYTHLAPLPQVGSRKDFVAELAKAVMQRLLTVPASQWEPLGGAIGQGLDAGQALAWSKDPTVAKVLSERGWDGRFPTTVGDFFYGSEFSYATKNGSDLRRTYDHVVAINPDGSARVTTTITIVNTAAESQLNPNTLSYITAYGPTEGVLNEQEGETPDSPEPTLSGHPAAGWFRTITPMESTQLKVVWDAPGIARQDADGKRFYGLWFLRVPDHLGDTLNLRVELPPGWRWRGPGPPARVDLVDDFVGVWELVAN